MKISINKALLVRDEARSGIDNMRIDDCLVLRSYTHKQFAALVKKVPSWTIEAAYDFSYDIDEPIEVDETTEDVVYILKRSAD